MTSVNIDYNCGCGYSTKDLEAAKKHADSHGHSLTVCGSIKASMTSKELKKTTRTVSKVVHKTSPFDDLRSNLSHSGQL